MGAIQVKNVPGDLHDRMRERAATRGLTLSQYILDLIRRDLRRPSREEWFDALDEVDLGAEIPADAIASMIREDRRDRDDELARRVGQPASQE